MANEFKVTDGRKVLLQSLRSGPKSWKELRLAYYGPERAKSKASTSFMGQLKKMKEVDFIAVNTEGKYELGHIGVSWVAANADKLEGEFKSIAAIKFVPKCCEEGKCDECPNGCKEV
jgi:predicted transcriptional regulator